MSCDQEMCPNWGGDGNVCICALFDLPREDIEMFDDITRAADEWTLE